MSDFWTSIQTAAAFGLTLSGMAIGLFVATAGNNTSFMTSMAAASLGMLIILISATLGMGVIADIEIASQECDES